MVITQQKIFAIQQTNNIEGLKYTVYLGMDTQKLTSTVLGQYG